MRLANQFPVCTGTSRVHVSWGKSLANSHDHERFDRSCDEAMSAEEVHERFRLFHRARPQVSPAEAAEGERRRESGWEAVEINNRCCLVDIRGKLASSSLI